MQVRHTLSHLSVKAEKEEASLLISNKNKGFTYISCGRKSRYNGVFFSSGDGIYRVIARLGGPEEKTEAINRLHHIELNSPSGKECFFMPYGMNSLVYGLESEKLFEVALDFRGIYDGVGGAAYKVWDEKNCVIVELEREGAKHYLAIHSGKDPAYELDGTYVYEDYGLDRARNSPPYDSMVYSALKLKAKEVVFSFSKDKMSAITEASWVYRNIGLLHKKQQKHVRDLSGAEKIESSEQRMAYLCARSSLDMLTTDRGIMAGLPWFFQEWTRDELISLKKEPGEYRKKICMSLLETLLSDGRIPNIGPGKTGNADSVGWLFARVDEDLKAYTSKEKKKIEEKLVESIIALSQEHVRDYLVYNSAQETWMDSTYNDSGRSGARIEIQALTLVMYRLAFRMTKNEKFKKLEKITKKRVKERFLEGGILKDGLEDATIRPNIFIAAYLYPELLSRKEWASCFDSALEGLWLSWGGLSSIDKKNNLYTGYSTGEDPRSYHRGDSWYYVNNMAALAMHRVDPERFKKEIDAIVSASTYDILWGGIAGHHSEISSAEEQTSSGCGAQAWSAALYLELLDEIYS